MKKILLLLIPVALFIGRSTYCDVTIPGTSLPVSGTEEKIPGTGLAVSGYASWEAGQVVKGVDVNGPTSHDWVQTGYIGLMVDDSISSCFRVLVQGEGQMQFSFNLDPGFVETYRTTETPQLNYNIKRGEGVLTLGDPPAVAWQVELGFFPYKYNSDARNLGEYLFRTFPYPQFIINVFDRPYANLLGLRIGTGVGDIFHGDLLFTSEIQNFPLEDFSLSYVADVRPIKSLDFGAGIDFDRLFPANNLLTTPTQLQDQYTTPGGATRYYTFAGTKVMARASFDPKCYIPADIFGTEDLKLYTEAAILGLKNYPVLDSTPAYYTNLSQRIPIMGGFDFPAFKLLDVLAVEVEYFSNPYPNSYSAPFENDAPVPLTSLPPGVSTLSKWKWSVYAKRSLGKHFFAVVQVARDHLIPLSNSLSATIQDHTDVLLRPGDWWWTAKTEFDF